MVLDKLKVAARQHEQREEWHAAIELYRQAIRASEEASEGVDPYLYSRIGDLEQRAGDLHAASEAWEQAASRYGDLGFSNNAIAICAKILRADPSRVRAHLELARFQARKGMFHEAEKDLAFFLKAMDQKGQSIPAREALQPLGGEFPGWETLQLVLDEFLGRDRSQPEPLAVSAPAQPANLVFIDTGTLTLERASEPEPADPAQPAPDVTSGIELDSSTVTPLAGLETTGLIQDPAESRLPEPSVKHADLVEPVQTTAEVAVIPVEGLIQESGTWADASGPTPRVEGIELTTLQDEVLPANSTPPSDLEREGAEGSDLVFLETGNQAVESNSETLEPPAALEPTREITPAADDDPLGHRAVGHAYLEVGDRAAGIASFERALQLYQEREEWLSAWQTASELVVAEPQHIGHHQARVEIASRLGDTIRRTEAYLDLGDALARTGAHEKAIAVFRRVLEHDEANQRARQALKELGSQVAAAPGGDGFVDFRAMVVDDGPRTTRMRTETTPVSQDEDETFREALAEFKRALDENLPLEDSQAHYDLGVAFREMGLLDEAIASFQKALRSPEARLRTSEALGATFFQQGRVAVAEAVLRNAERGAEAEDEKIGVLYWLGRALETQGRKDEALACYQRVLAVDVFFLDVSERIRQIQEEGN